MKNLITVFVLLVVLLAIACSPLIAQDLSNVPLISNYPFKISLSGTTSSISLTDTTVFVPVSERKQSGFQLGWQWNQHPRIVSNRMGMSLTATGFDFDDVTTDESWKYSIDNFLKGIPRKAERYKLSLLSSWNIRAS